MEGEDRHTSTYLARVVDFIGRIQTHKENGLAFVNGET